MTQKRVFVTENPFLSHFWPFFGSIGRRPPRVTFESLLGHVNCFVLLGALGGATDHKTTPFSDPDSRNSWAEKDRIMWWRLAADKFVLAHTYQRLKGIH